MSTATPHHARVLRLPAVIEMVGLRRASIYNMMKANRFPKPVRIGERAVAWREADLVNWLAEREVA